jgi:hypothetical protein
VNGTIACHPQESTVVVDIFRAYLNGQSLLTIAEALNEKKIEYMAGIIGWNKARLKRIIEDERYLGKREYPSIVDEKSYQEIQTIKESKNVQKFVNRKAVIFKLDVPMYCSKCGGEMRRVTDSRFVNKVKWRCKKHGCKTIVAKSDDDLIKEIGEILSWMQENPETIAVDMKERAEPYMKTQVLKNEISRLLDSIDINKELVREKMLHCVAQEYKELDESESQMERLKDIFRETQPINGFNLELFDKTVKAIKLSTDGAIHLILINNQEIQKEQKDGKESGSCDTTDNQTTGADEE